MSAPIRIRVSAPNAPNPLGRYCDAKGAKPARRWKEPVIVEVVDAPQSDAQISHACFTALQADEFIKVEFLSDGIAAAEGSELSAIKSQLAAAQAKIAQLTADLAAEADRLADERRMGSAAAEEMAQRYATLEGELAVLRARMTERASRKG